MCSATHVLRHRHDVICSVFSDEAHGGGDSCSKYTFPLVINRGLMGFISVIAYSLVVISIS